MRKAEPNLNQRGAGRSPVLPVKFGGGQALNFAAVGILQGTDSANADHRGLQGPNSLPHCSRARQGSVLEPFQQGRGNSTEEDQQMCSAEHPQQGRIRHRRTQKTPKAAAKQVHF